MQIAVPIVVRGGNSVVELTSLGDLVLGGVGSIKFILI